MTQIPTFSNRINLPPSVKDNKALHKPNKGKTISRQKVQLHLSKIGTHLTSQRKYPHSVKFYMFFKSGHFKAFCTNCVLTVGSKRFGYCSDLIVQATKCFDLSSRSHNVKQTSNPIYFLFKTDFKFVSREDYL